jgi:hypothetical protein
MWEFATVIAFVIVIGSMQPECWFPIIIPHLIPDPLSDM